MPHIQTLIHRLEVGGGSRFLKYGLLALVVLLLLVSYNFRGYKNMANPEAMDAAQVARNLAEHKGFSTLCVRPFSMYLVQKTYAAKHGPAPLGDTTDRAQINSLHPDLANPPVYPLLLAGVMKLNSGLRHQDTADGTLKLGRKHLHIWSPGVYAPDFWISLLNQVMFLGLVVTV